MQALLLWMALAAVEAGARRRDEVPSQPLLSVLLAVTESAESACTYYSVRRHRYSSFNVLAGQNLAVNIGLLDFAVSLYLGRVVDIFQCI